MNCYCQADETVLLSSSAYGGTEIMPFLWGFLHMNLKFNVPVGQYCITL